MTLRWIVRGFAIALLTLCLSLWVWSYLRYFYASYSPSANKSYSVDTYMGGVRFSSHDATWPWSPPGWEFGHIRGAYPFSQTGLRQLMGFGYPGFVVSTSTFWEFSVPFWFPSLLSAGLLWFVWWRTRAAREGRGFPVEINR